MHRRRDFPVSTQRRRWRHLGFYLVCGWFFGFILILRYLPVDNVAFPYWIVNNLVFGFLLLRLFGFFDGSQGFFSRSLDFVDGFVEVEVPKQSRVFGLSWSWLAVIISIGGMIGVGLRIVFEEFEFELFGELIKIFGDIEVFEMVEYFFDQSLASKLNFDRRDQFQVQRQKSFIF